MSGEKQSGEVRGSERGRRRSTWQRLGQTLGIPLLALLTALIVSAVFIVGSDQKVYAAFGGGFVPGLREAGSTIGGAYGALLEGSFGKPAQLVEGIRSLRAARDAEASAQQGVEEAQADFEAAPPESREEAQARLEAARANLEEARKASETAQKTLLDALYPLSESLSTAVPYIFAGLAVALGFRCGLFNIGAEGQLFVGALASAYLGYAIEGLPVYIHLPVALLGGALAAAIWGAVPGLLKAWRGAHEVIVTIMMNYIAFRLADYLLTGPMKRSGYNPVSPLVLDTSKLPRLFPPLRFHAGFFVALAMAALVYWLLWKTTTGFEIRTVGANPDAARYAGISVTRNIVLAMGLSGALAGMAGANEVLGVNYFMAQAFSSGYGFDSIALALLGKSHPLGVVIASFLWGFLRAGAIRMQSRAAIPIDIIFVIQAMVIIFVAAPEMIRWLYRIRAEREVEEAVFTRGWGG